MSFFEDEILDDLEVGKIYTEKEISSIVYFKDDTIILCEDSSRFNSNNNEQRYKVLERLETYLHRRDNQSRSYILPNRKSVIYKIEKVY